MDGVLKYVRKVHKIDPHAQHAPTLPPGEIFDSAKVFPLRVSTRHPFYRDFWSDYNLNFLTGGKGMEEESLVALFGFSAPRLKGHFQTRRKPQSAVCSSTWLRPSNST